MAVLLTGATGFIGRRLAVALLDRGRDVVAIARGRSEAEARRRVEAVLPAKGNGAARGRLDVCAGRLDVPGLGLSRADEARLVAECDEIVHAGASVRFDLPLEQARAVNVGGTTALLALARERQRRGGLRRFHHVSTAFVAGKRADLVFEGELDGAAGHKNTYERSKFESEVEVRRAAADLPVTVYRPSIVVGDSATGATANFNAFYWPTRVYALGIWRFCPGRAQAPLDLVPVNFVADAILHLGARADSVGRCFHLAAGPPGAVTVGQMAELLHGYFPHRKPVRFVDPDWWARYVQPVLPRVTLGRLRQTMRTAEYYVPYLSGNPQFDNSGARELLAGSGLEVPSVLEYARTLLDFCVETDWGRLPPHDGER